MDDLVVGLAGEARQRLRSRLGTSVTIFGNATARSVTPIF